MLYLSTPSAPAVRDAMAAGELGCMTTPAQGNRVPDGAWWAADNGVFGQGYPGDTEWLDWLGGLPYPAERCVFATAPDVVGDAAATLRRSVPFLPTIRGLGLPAALVGQDGLEDEPVPWDDFDVLFLGGTTEWKLGPGARLLAGQARGRGKWVHMGRVNSLRRLRYAQAIGCNSADGTFLAFGPDRRLPEALRWVRELVGQPRLFEELS